MKCFAVTGGIACGKSLCGDFLRDLGCRVCDTDKLGHDLLKRGTPVYHAVLRRFGRETLDDKTDICRRRLGRRVFKDQNELAELNAILHPAIRNSMRRWINDEESKGYPALAVLIPLFYETNEQRREWDRVICVAAPPKLCVQRMRKRGWSAQEIGRRNRTQLPVAEKMRRADVVLYNNGSPEWLRRQVELFWRKSVLVNASC